MTHLVASIRVNDPDQAAAEAAEARAAGATAIELRIDTLRSGAERLRGQLLAKREAVWIVTCRAPDEGGEGPADPAVRARLLSEVARDTGAFVDFEYAALQSAKDAREAALLAARCGGESRLIVSAHDFAGMHGDPAGQLAAMSAVPDACAVKLAATARDIRDAITMLGLLRQQAKPTIAIAMGEPGLVSRVLAPRFDAFATYASLNDDGATAPGQVPLADMVHLYRATAMTRQTRLFGVIGSPVAHSMSPALHNAWFAAAGVDAVYIPLRIDDDAEVFAGFLDMVRGTPELNAGGFSVTIPHKQTAARYARAHADETAQRIGAVNTLTIAAPDPASTSRLRTLTATNSDAAAAVGSLQAACAAGGVTLQGAAVDVLGAGGAARAILAGLAPLGCRVTVYGRDATRTTDLCAAFGATPARWEDRGARRGRIIINATNIGMWPDVDASPLPAYALRGGELVFDVVYHPRRTRLLALAEAEGARTLGGLDMFLGQAARQFEVWTGLRPDMELGRRVVTERLAVREREGSP